MGSLINFSISQYWILKLHVALRDQINRLSAEYRERTQTGEQLTFLERDVDEIANPGAAATNPRIRAILFVVLNLAMMAKLNLPMTLTILPMIPLLAVI